MYIYTYIHNLYILLYIHTFLSLYIYSFYILTDLYMYARLTTHGKARDDKKRGGVG